MSNTTRIQLRGDIASNWTTANPVLAEREMGLETDTNKFKIGDGSLAWNALGYYVEPTAAIVLTGGTNINITDDYQINLDSKIAGYEFIAAASDETTAITTGTSKVTFLCPSDFTLTGATASLTTAGTTLTTIDINNNAVSIFSTLLTVDANEKNSTTAGTPPVITGGAWSQFDEITVDIDVAGTNATGLKILFTGTRTI